MEEVPVKKPGQWTWQSRKPNTNEKNEQLEWTVWKTIKKKGSRIYENWEILPSWQRILRCKKMKRPTYSADVPYLLPAGCEVCRWALGLRNLYVFRKASYVIDQATVVLVKIHFPIPYIFSNGKHSFKWGRDLHVFTKIGNKYRHVFPPQLNQRSYGLTENENMKRIKKISAKRQ